MTWATRFRVREYLLELWVVPLVGAIGGVLGALAVVAIDQSVQLPAQLQDSASTATAVLSAVIGATAALTGFVVTVTVRRFVTLPLPDRSGNPRPVDWERGCAPL